MIPAYHCNSFLPLCIGSVISQHRAGRVMQIAVVNDDPVDITCSIIAGRFATDGVAYYQNTRNLGAGGNFNRCLELAIGDLVLILHGDCYLKDGFFDAFDALACANPTVGMLACRAEGVDEQGNLLWESRRYPEFEILTRDDSPIWLELHLMPSAVVVRRSVYQQIGGFREDIANGQDWEMWARAIRMRGIVMTPDVLSGYRQHSDSITGRTKRTAQNIREFAKLYCTFSQQIPGYPLETSMRGLRGIAWFQAQEYRRHHDDDASAANMAAWCRITPLSERLVTYLKYAVKTMLGRT
jgi:glycosyltransferase involved in cell wall biosynthesis